MFGITPFSAAPFAALGNVSVDVSVTGVSATGRVQTPLVWGNINDSQDPNWRVIPT